MPRPRVRLNSLQLGHVWSSSRWSVRFAPELLEPTPTIFLISGPTTEITIPLTGNWFRSKPMPASLPRSSDIRPRRSIVRRMNCFSTANAMPSHISQTSGKHLAKNTSNSGDPFFDLLFIVASEVQSHAIRDLVSRKGLSR